MTSRVDFNEFLIPCKACPVIVDHWESASMAMSANLQIVASDLNCAIMENFYCKTSMDVYLWCQGK